MNPGELYILLPGVLLAGAIIAWFLHTRHAARVRRDELAALASRRGMAFVAQPPATFCARYAGSDFLKGDHGWGENLLHGRHRDLDWEVFDYTYLGSRKSKRHDWFGVVAARGGRQFPNLVIRPERWYDALAKMAGRHDVTVGSASDGAGAFDSRYHVTSSDPELARRILHSGMVAYLTRLPDYHWQFAGARVIVHRRGVLSATQVAEVMGAIEGFFALLPQGLLPAQDATRDVDDSPPPGSTGGVPSSPPPRRARTAVFAAISLLGIGVSLFTYSKAAESRKQKAWEKRYNAVLAEIADRQNELDRIEIRAKALGPAPATRPDLTTVPTRDGRVDFDALPEHVEQITQQAHHDSLVERRAAATQRLAELRMEREQLESKR